MGQIERSGFEGTKDHWNYEQIESFTSLGESPKKLPLYCLVFDKSIFAEPTPNHFLH